MFWFIKNFNQDQKLNKRNDEWLCVNPREVPSMRHIKFTRSVMVLGVMSNTFYLRIKTTTYIKVLDMAINLWM